MLVTSTTGGAGRDRHLSIARIFGTNYPIGHSAQPKELAPGHVMLATDEGGYFFRSDGANYGGKPFSTCGVLGTRMEKDE